MPALTLTVLSANLCEIIDQIIETGNSIEVERNGTKVFLVLKKKLAKLEKLAVHPGTIAVDPDSIVHINWLHELSAK